ncbi:MAG: hypothetical protein AAFU58_06685 [Pseudomonadota bacterium]
MNNQTLKATIEDGWEKRDSLADVPGIAEAVDGAIALMDSGAVRVCEVDKIADGADSRNYRVS